MRVTSYIVYCVGMHLLPWVIRMGFLEISGYDDRRALSKYTLIVTAPSYLKNINVFTVK